MDFMSTVKGSLLEGFYPKGWDMAKIDRCCANRPADATKRQPFWNKDFKPLPCADVAEFDVKMGHEIANEIRKAKEAGRTVYTDAYRSTTGDMVVSASAPFYGRGGEFLGAICGDITLSVLKERVEQIRFQGKGNGLIVQQDGKILATTGYEPLLSDIRAVAGVGPLFDQMLIIHIDPIRDADCECTGQILYFACRVECRGSNNCH